MGEVKKTNLLMVKTVDVLTPESGHLIIEHDHHNTRLNTVVQAVRAVATENRYYVKIEIPDFKSV